MSRVKHEGLCGGRNVQDTKGDVEEMWVRWWELNWETYVEVRCQSVLMLRSLAFFFSPLPCLTFLTYANRCGGVCLFPKVKKNSLKEIFGLCCKRVRATHHSFSSLPALSWLGEIGLVQFQFHSLFYKHIRAWPAIKMENSSCSLINTSWEMPVFLRAASSHKWWKA